MSQSIIRSAHASIEDREARIKGLSFPELTHDGHRFSCFRSLTPIFLRCFTSSLRLVDENSPAIRRMRTRTRTRTHARGVRICTDGGEGGKGRPEASSSSLSSTSLRSLKESKGANDGEDGEQGRGGSEMNNQDGDGDGGDKTVAGWLPEGWEGYWDEHTDSPYYFNTRTGETQWDAPESEEINRLAEEGGVGGSSNGDPNIATSRSVHAESARSACSTRAGRGSTALDKAMQRTMTRRAHLYSKSHH